MGNMARLGAKLFRTKTSRDFPMKALTKSFFPKKRFRSEFFYETAPHLILGPNGLYGAFGGKIVPDENFARFCLESPCEIVFLKTTFSVRIFLRNRTSPFFGAKQTIWRVFGPNCSGAKFRFSENIFSTIFFYETAPSPIFWAKRSIWRVWGQNCSRRKLRLILPRKSLRNRFSLKHVFGPNVFTKLHLI